MPLELVAAIVAVSIVVAVALAAWITASRCPHCGRGAESRTFGTPGRS